VTAPRRRTQSTSPWAAFTFLGRRSPRLYARTSRAPRTEVRPCAFPKSRHTVLPKLVTVVHTSPNTRLTLFFYNHSHLRHPRFDTAARIDRIWRRHADPNNRRYPLPVRVPNKRFLQQRRGVRPVPPEHGESFAGRDARLRFGRAFLTSAEPVRIARFPNPKTV
jgi:hypothetical protein